MHVILENHRELIYSFYVCLDARGLRWANLAKCVGWHSLLNNVPMRTPLNPFLMHLLSLSLSTDSAKKAQITEVRGSFTLYIRLCHLSLLLSSSLSHLSSALVCCMVQFHMTSEGSIYTVFGVHKSRIHLYIPFLSLWQMPSPFGVGQAHEKKIGHRRVDASGETTYKKVDFALCLKYCLKLCFASWFHQLRSTHTLLWCSFLCSSPPDHLLCLARGHPAGYWIYCWQPQLQAWERCADAGLLCGGKHLLSQVCLYECMCAYVHVWVARSEYDLLSCFILPHLARYSEGSNLTPAHHFPDFRFKTYAPVAFRYFRELFGIRPDDYLVRYLFSWMTGDALRVFKCLIKCWESEMYSVTYSISCEANMYKSRIITCTLWLANC